MAVTRTKLASPPEPPPRPAPTSPKAEAHDLQDWLRVVGYFVGRAGQRRSLAQTVIGARLPTDRALKALDGLTGCGYLTPSEPRRAGAGWVPTWVRVDPPVSYL